MHQLIEGLNGVEVVADDFVVVGFGDTVEAAVIDHDQNLKAFLQRGEARGIKLNAENVSLRMREVPFIGHVATDKGLCVNPSKVRAISEMPPPTDVAAIQGLLGMTQYLSKFFHISQTSLSCYVILCRRTPLYLGPATAARPGDAETSRHKHPYSVVLQFGGRSHIAV